MLTHRGSLLTCSNTVHGRLDSVTLARPYEPAMTAQLQATPDAVGREGVALGMLEHKIHCNNRFLRSQRWDEQVGPNGKDGKIDRRLPPSRRLSSSRSRSLRTRMSRASQVTGMSAGVAAGSVRVAPGSMPRLRPARRRTGPGSTTQRIGRLPCDLSGDSVLLNSSSGRSVPAPTPSRRRRCGSPPDGHRRR